MIQNEVIRMILPSSRTINRERERDNYILKERETARESERVTTKC